MTDDRRTEDGVPVGNRIDKGRLRHPVARRLVAGFDAALESLLAALWTHVESVHDVGCGEGRLSLQLRDALGRPVRASDFSHRLIAENQARQAPGIRYVVRSIYDLDPAEDSADLVVCCEVLEHLARPVEGLAALRSLRASHYILSVPREPLWRVLNVARGKYLFALGNTPGHLCHWSAGGFVRFLEAGGFRVRTRLQPLPWTMVAGRFES